MFICNSSMSQKFANASCIRLKVIYIYYLTVPAWEGSAAFCMWCKFLLLLPILSENGFGLLDIDFVCLTSDSLTTDQYHIETFTCSLFTIKSLTPEARYVEVFIISIYLLY